jgi:hypothetical protein
MGFNTPFHTMVLMIPRHLLSTLENFVKIGVKLWSFGQTPKVVFATFDF